MQIPSHAKRVYAGIIYDIYQWDQTLFDGSTETYEAVRRPDSVQIIPVMGDQVLIAEEKQPHRGAFLGMFGGRKEPNEEPLNAAKRELLEETGLQSSDWELLGTHMFPGAIHWTTYLYIARDCRKVSAPTPEIGEHILVRSLDFNGFLEVLTDEHFRAKGLMTHFFSFSLSSKDQTYLHNKLFERSRQSHS